MLMSLFKLVPLLVLFDLLTELILSMPGFLKTLLLSKPTPQEEQLSIVSILQNVVLEHLPADKIPARNDLACVLLTLLESICFHPTPSSIEQYVFSLLVHIAVSTGNHE